MSIKYTHTNIITKDWKKLVKFYVDVFNCTPIYPERDLKGDWIDKLTKIDDVNIKGIHVALPGYENGPTLEIFEYNKDIENDQKINKIGFSHIAFHVESVEQVLENLLKSGGEKNSEIIKKDYGDLGLLTVVYAKDPDGNYVEIQNWRKNS